MRYVCLLGVLLFALGCQQSQSPPIQITKIGQQINVWADAGEKPGNASGGGWARFDQRMGSGTWTSTTDTSAGDASNAADGTVDATVDLTP